MDFWAVFLSKFKCTQITGGLGKKNSDFVSLSWALIIYISNKLPGDALDHTLRTKDIMCLGITCALLAWVVGCYLRLTAMIPG